MLYSLRSYKQRMRYHRSSLRRFLSKIEKKKPKNIDQLVNNVSKAVWKEVDCLACANCCKTMTPTYTAKDMKRISAHLHMSVAEFKKRWLYKDRSGDWMNTKTPCQFLQKDNTCSIYAVRPRDCSGFPYLTIKMIDYMHVHKQNVEYCPATFTMVEKIKALYNKE